MERVCVTGGSGFIASWLIKKLLEKGYVVHATLRNIDDASKTGLLKSLPHADSRLILFKADVNNPCDFEPAFQGCSYVFHMATLLHNTNSSKYNDTSDGSIAAVRNIVDLCIKSKTVKRIIYTASVLSASPLTEDGAGGFNFRSSVDESCWTPLNLLSCSTSCNPFVLEYIKSKTLSEKEILRYNDERNCELEIVSLACALVAGDTLLPQVALSLKVVVSHLTGNILEFNFLRNLQEVLGCIPLVHIDDVCDAHLFCIEKRSIRGRFLCAVGDTTLGEIGNHFRQHYPEFEIPDELMEPSKRGSRLDATILMKEGFIYKYEIEKILDDSVRCGKRLGAFTQKA